MIDRGGFGGRGCREGDPPVMEPPHISDDPGRPDRVFEGAPGAMLVIISGPSGVGKDTIIDELRRREVLPLLVAALAADSTVSAAVLGAMLISKDMNAAINQQIGNELGASNQYVSIATYFDGEGLPALAQHGLEILTWEDLRPQTAVIANTGAGADVVCGFATDPHVYTSKLVDMTDLAEYLGAKYGGWYDVAELYGKKWKTDNWVSLPIGGGSGACGCCIVRSGMRAKAKVIGVQAARDPCTHFVRADDHVTL